VNQEITRSEWTREKLRSRVTIRKLIAGLFSTLAAGVVFIDENGGGPGVRLQKRQQRKG